MPMIRIDVAHDLAPCMLCPLERRDVTPGVAELEIPHAVGAQGGVTFDLRLDVERRIQHPASAALRAFDHHIVGDRAIIDIDAERIRHPRQGVGVERQHTLTAACEQSGERS